MQTRELAELIAAWRVWVSGKEARRLRKVEWDMIVKFAVNKSNRSLVKAIFHAIKESSQEVNQRNTAIG